VSKNFELMEELQSKTWIETSVRSVAAEAPATHRAEVDSETLALVQRVFLLHPHSPPRLVVFAGVGQSDESHQLCQSVAEALAKSTHRRVCLVDADFRTHSTSVFGVNDSAGLADALASENPIQTYARVSNGKGSWWWIPAGRITSNSLNLLGSEKMKSLVAQLRVDFDFVVFLAPRLSHYTDAIVMAQLTDGCVLIIEAGATRRESAQAATLSLRAANIPILAAVLRNRTYPIPESIYNRL
jgi:Mrp family chromosome partitioning ATPase